MKTCDTSPLMKEVKSGLFVWSTYGDYVWTHIILFFFFSLVEDLCFLFEHGEEGERKRDCSQ